MYKLISLSPENEIDHSPSPSPNPEDPCADAAQECSAVFNCNYGVERWINQHGCERSVCDNTGDWDTPKRRQSILLKKIKISFCTKISFKTLK